MIQKIPNRLRLSACLVLFTLFFSSCNDKQQTASKDDSIGSSITKAEQKSSRFQPEIYSSLRGSIEVKLISPEQLEYKEKNTRYLCQYSRDSTNLRFVLNAGFGDQVIYLNITNEGLRNEQVGVLYNPKSLAKVRNIVAEQNRIKSVNKKFHKACTSADLALLKDLIDQGADIDNAVFGRYPIQDIIESSTGMLKLKVKENPEILECVKYLLSVGADANSINGNGQTLLYNLFNYQFENSTYSSNLTEMLIDAGADPNLRLAKYPFRAALYRSIAVEHDIEASKILVASGADVTYQYDEMISSLEQTIKYHGNEEKRENARRAKAWLIEIIKK